MRRSFLVSLCGILLLAATASAQEPKPEVFLGYSYANIDTIFNRKSFHGGIGEVHAPLSDKVGVVGGISYHRGDIEGIDGSVTTFTGGIRFTGRSDKGDGFFHVQAGGVRGKVAIEILGTTFSESVTGFAGIVGAGYNYAFNDKFAFRVVQADYVYTRLTGESGHNFRVSTGIVFRF